MNRLKKLFIFTTCIALFSSNSYSQANFPEKGPVFRDDMVPRVDVFINPDTLAWIYENVESDIEFRAQFVFATDTLHDTINNIGFRLRGNTSRVSQKKSFKISFNTFQDGGKYYGLEKTNLNGEHNDPSVIRSKIAWDLLRSFGIPAPRANHVQVFINGNYYGLYIQVEHIDEEFVLSRFENQDGNLFKCLYPADLNFISNNPDDYKMMAGDRRVYDLKTNTQTDDYSDLAQFIHILNNVPSAVFPCEIENEFNVYDYLRVIALDIFLGNWDGPIYNKNNFYLYHNTQYNRFEYIPYDLDNILGIDWFGKDWSTRNIYDWNNHSEPRPIYTKMMASSELREIYSQYMMELIQDHISGSVLTERILSLKAMIRPYILNDPYYPLDYGYSVQSFDDSYQMGVDSHAPIGLIPYLDARRASALEQLESFQEHSIINHVRQKAKEDGSELRIRAYVREASDSVMVVFRENEGEWQTLQMFDDGEHLDINAGDGVYANTLYAIPINTNIQYQIRVIHSNGIETISPCVPIEYYYHESLQPQLVINEFMADNDSIISDEYGAFSDWIEVYNADSEDVYLGDKYLTDNLSNPDKWLMPDMTLEAGHFALFWADDDTEKGPFHTNFKLSKEGEEIGIFDAANTGFFPLDTLIYESQITNVSQGRYPDGGDEWRLYVHPTPGITNLFDAIDEQMNYSSFNVFPNPNNIGQIYLNRRSELQIFNINGVIMKNFASAISFDISDLASGVYIARFPNGQAVKLIVQ